MLHIREGVVMKRILIAEDVLDEGTLPVASHEFAFAGEPP
jgi:hypothetical protein